MQRRPGTSARGASMQHTTAAMRSAAAVTDAHALLTARRAGCSSVKPLVWRTIRSGSVEGVGATAGERGVEGGPQRGRVTLAVRAAPHIAGGRCEPAGPVGRVVGERLGGGRRLSLRRVRRGRRFSTQHFELDLRQLDPAHLLHKRRIHVHKLECRRVAAPLLHGSLGHDDDLRVVDIGHMAAVGRQVAE